MHEQTPPIAFAEALPDQLEHDQQASLFEHFADKVFEIYGQRGTLRQLLNDGGCPVPPEQRSFAATERFTAKLAERSGLEIPERFSHLISPEPTNARRDETPKIEKVHKLPETTSPAKVESDPEPSLVMVVGGAPSSGGGPSTEEQINSLLTEAKNEALSSVTEVKPLKSNAAKAGKAVLAPRLKPVTSIPKTVDVEALVLKPVREKIQGRLADLATAAPVTLIESATTIAPSVTASPSVEQYLGELYEAAALEVNEAETGVALQEFADIDQAIADVLDTPIGAEGVTEYFDGQAFLLPEPLESGMLNVLSEQAYQAPEALTDTVQAPILRIMPEAVSNAYASASETLTVQETERLTELVESMSLIAERLNLLVTSDRAESEEAVQIEQVLEELYDQIHSLLGLQVDETERKKFIAAIRSDVFQQLSTAAFELPADEGTHEFKRVIISQAHQLPVLWQQTVNLTRYIMKLGVNHTVA